MVGGCIGHWERKYKTGVVLKDGDARIYSQPRPLKESEALPQET